MIMKRIVSLLLVLWFVIGASLPGFTQSKASLNKYTFGEFKAREIGPAAMSGRISCLDAVHEDPRIVYIGAASGGIWKSKNAGTTFKPVFDEHIVADMVRQGIKRLIAMQLTDGGWGWFSGWGERAYPHTTAYVVHGLQTAAANGAATNRPASHGTLAPAANVIAILGMIRSGS